MKPRALVLSAAAFALAFAASARADDVAPVAPAAGVQFEPGTPSFADVLAKSKESGKPVFIDFTTEWCGWCRKLEADTYSQASVGEAMKAFVNVMVDAEKGEGPAIAKRYGVTGFPTLVIVDAEGGEIDRISGYRPPEPFLKEIARIRSGEGTLPALTKAFAERPDDVDAGVALAVKLSSAKPEESAALFATLSEKAKSMDKSTQAKVMLERAAASLATARKKETMVEVATTAETLVKDFADTPSAAQATSKLGRAILFLDTKRALAFVEGARAVAKDPKEISVIEGLTVSVHRNALAAALKRQGDGAGDDPMALNEAAWNCFELKMNVKQALAWAQTAVEKSKRDPMILDTLANLLWLTGKHDDAIKTEVEAAGKAEGSMKKEFEANVAKWRAELKVKAGGESDEDGEDDDEDEKEKK
jgi:thiol-disulfide isomerase/thioredoxin